MEKNEQLSAHGVLRFCDFTLAVAFTDTKYTSATTFRLHLNGMNIFTSDCHEEFSVFISTVFSISLFYFY